MHAFVARSIIEIDRVVDIDRSIDIGRSRRPTTTTAVD
jgi:hypothetical protein